MNTITMKMPIATARLVLVLVRIALKTHGYNVSPVHIKEELAETDKQILAEIEGELTEHIR